MSRFKNFLKENKCVPSKLKFSPPPPPPYNFRPTKTINAFTVIKWALVVVTQGKRLNHCNKTCRDAEEKPSISWHILATSYPAYFQLRQPRHVIVTEIRLSDPEKKNRSMSLSCWDNFPVHKIINNVDGAVITWHVLWLNWIISSTYSI